MIRVQTVEKADLSRPRLDPYGHAVRLSQPEVEQGVTLRPVAEIGAHLVSAQDVLRAGLQHGHLAAQLVSLQPHHHRKPDSGDVLHGRVWRRDQLSPISTECSMPSDEKKCLKRLRGKGPCTWAFDTFSAFVAYVLDHDFRGLRIRILKPTRLFN